jgi:transposase-like protein
MLHVPFNRSALAYPTVRKNVTAALCTLINSLERINRELKRRTRVASIFPNTASCLRLVSALLAECDEEWLTGKVYLNLRA